MEQTSGQFAQQGMDVKSLFTPELVRNLMDSSRPEAEERLRRSLALTALAESEKLTVEDSDIDAKLEEVKQQLAGERDIDPERLRQAVLDDLLQDKLLGWLEENSTVTDKAPEDIGKDDNGAVKQAAAKSGKTTDKKTTTKPKSTKNDGDGAEA